MRFSFLVLLFTVIPAVEIALFVAVGGRIGPMATFAVILFTGIAGAALARMQGLAVLQKIQGAMEQGKMPTDEIFQGALVLVGGVLLLTPGFLTDGLGLSCLVPGTRRILLFCLRATIAQRVVSVGPGRTDAFGFRVWTGGVHPGPGAARPSGGPREYEPPPPPLVSHPKQAKTIDATFSVLDEEEEEPS